MARRKAEAPAHRASTPEPAAHDTDDEPEELALPPFFNTTFSTHRVSPLHVGAQKLSQARLDTLARRLRDTLVGDVVRGIQVGLEAADTPLGQQVGPLRAVRIRWFSAEDVLGRSGEEEQQEGGDRVGDLVGLSDEQKQGLWIEIRHENASYVALLLPAFSTTTTTTATTGTAGAPRWSMRSGNGNRQGDGVDGSRFADLPLLLMKMPVALKTVVSDWLASTFDCRVSRLSLGTRTLVRVWEGWMQAQQAGSAHPSADLVVTLAFNAPLAPKDAEEEYGEEEAGLKSMEISVPSTELRRFLRAGEAILKDRGKDKGKEKDKDKDKATTWDTIDERERRRLAGPNTDDGWAWRRGGDGPGDPFTEALGRYLDHHLALDLFHPGVRVVQVACGGFVLAQSRVKIVRPGLATDEGSARVAWMFVMQLGERIRGGTTLSAT